MTEDEYTLGEIELFLTERFKCSGIDVKKNSLEPVIDVLERIADQLRYKYNYTDKSVSIGQFLDGTVSIDSGVLSFSPCSKRTAKMPAMIPAMKSTDIQPRLLVYLLLHYKNDYRISDILNSFVKKIRPELSLLDFEKTTTGVMRCHTNTRFAAKVLRDYGLIKNTDKEAYKTWKLSMAGLVVAADLVESRAIPAEICGSSTNYPHFLIMQSLKKVIDYNDFVNRLGSICRTGFEMFYTFGDVLQLAYNSLNEYWRVMKSESSVSEKQEKSKDLIGRIESYPGIDKFYEQFSTHLNIVEIEERFKYPD